VFGSLQLKFERLWQTFNLLLMFVANDVEFLPFVQARLKRDNDVGVEVQASSHAHWSTTGQKQIDAREVANRKKILTQVTCVHLMHTLTVMK
jgi:hypothetical protein